MKPALFFQAGNDPTKQIRSDETNHASGASADIQRSAAARKNVTDVPTRLIRENFSHDYRDLTHVDSLIDDRQTGFGERTRHVDLVAEAFVA